MNGKDRDRREKFSGFLRFQSRKKIDGSKQEHATLFEVSVVAVGVLTALLGLALWAASR